MSKKSNVITNIWSPLKFTQEGMSTKVDCYNRTYVMNGPIPTKIVSGGNAVLSSPARIKATFNGKEQPFINTNTYIQEQTDDKILYCNQATIGNVIIDSRVSIERDGLIWVDFMVFPFTPSGALQMTPGQNVISLDSLVLEFPIKKDVAELFHCWPLVDPNDALSNSGSIPKDGLNIPFRPHLWIGKEQAGLSFYAETNEFWQSADTEKVYTVENKDDTALFCVHLLDEKPYLWADRKSDNWVKAVEPLRFSFGLQATPVKPYTSIGDYQKVCHKGLGLGSDIKAQNDDLNSFVKDADELKSLGVKWRTFHEDWSMIQNYGQPQDEELFKAKVKELHKRGIKVMTYFGYEYSSIAPNFYDNYNDNLVRTESGSLMGGWQRNPPQRDYIVCYASNYSEVMLERCRKAMDEYGVDGIYTDGTYIPQACANGNHGCGWTDKEGVRHVTYPLLKVREHVKKLYIQTHERGGIVEAHQSGCAMPMLLAYCDSYWDGELIAQTVDPVTGGYVPLTGQQLIEKFTNENGSGMGTMRAEFTGVNFGIPCHFLSYSPTYDECCGLTLLFGVYPKPNWQKESLEQASRHWKIIDKYGLKTERFIPFWRNDCPVKCVDKRVTCSAWNTDDGVMAVFVNLSGEPCKTQFTCEKQYSQAVDLRDESVISSSQIEFKDVAPVYVFFKK